MIAPANATVFPFRAASPSGMSAELNENGSLRRMDCGDIMLNVFLGNEAEGGQSNIHLRSNGKSIPLLGVFLRVLVGLAAVVSALVVMLAMYTTITERTREIGILKAMGA